MNEKLIDYFKIFSDPIRVQIIELLLKGETCGCTLINKVPITQPTLSYHLKNITNAGLATANREGNWIKHYINKDQINEMIKYLESLRDMEAQSCKL